MPVRIRTRDATVRRLGPTAATSVATAATAAAASVATAATAVATAAATAVATAASLAAAALMLAAAITPATAAQKDRSRAPLRAPGDPAWARIYGDAGWQYGRSVAVDSSGNIAIAGDFRGTFTLGDSTLENVGPENNIYVARLTPSGTPVWSRSFGDVAAESIHDVAVDDAGHTAITGYFEGDLDFGGGVMTATGIMTPDGFVAVFDSAGQHVWSRHLDGQGGYGTALAFDSTGTLYVTGYFQNWLWAGGDTLYSDGGSDVFYARYTAQGTHLWSRHTGGASDNYGLDIALDSDGRVLLAGRTYSGIDLGGSHLPGNSADLFLVKYDAAGGHLWSRIFGDDMTQLEINVGVDADHNILLAGSFQGTISLGGGPLQSVQNQEAFIARLYPSGLHIWSHAVGGADYQYRVSMDSDRAGNMVITGIQQTSTGVPPDFGGGPLTPGGYTDIFVAAYHADGSHIWSGLFGDALQQQGEGIALGPSGEAILIASVEGTTDFGTGPLTAVDGWDIAVAKLEMIPDPSPHTGTPVPSAATTLRAYPNPFNPTTTLSFVVPPGAPRVRVDIYDLRGARVRTLIAGAMPPGPGSVVWNGRDHGGNPVASGVYLARFECRGGIDTAKLVLVR